MKRSFISTLTILSMLLASTLRAEGSPPVQTPAEEAQAEEFTLAEPNTEEEGTPVGQASNEGAHTAKNRMWQNIALAAGAVAIAITALILVSTNEGHTHHKKHK